MSATDPQHQTDGRRSAVPPAALVPDTDGDLLHVLMIVEETLLTLARWEEDDEVNLPEPLAGGTALAAVQRIYALLKPTQARAPATGRLLAPDGRYEHLPLAVVHVDARDVQTLSATAAALGRPRGSEDVAEAVEQMAQAHDSTRQEVVSRLARVAGLLDLSATQDSERLIRRLDAAQPGADIVLTDEEEAAYRATTDRLNAMWALGSGLDRWLY